MKKTLPLITALALPLSACGPALPDPCDPPMDIKHRAMCDDDGARVASGRTDKGDTPTKRPGKPKPKSTPKPKPKPGDGKGKPKPTGDGSKGDGGKKPKGDGKGKPKGKGDGHKYQQGADIRYLDEDGNLKVLGDNGKGDGGGDGAPGKSPHGDGDR